MKNEKIILQHCILNKQHLIVPSILLDGLGSVYNKKSGFFFQSPTYSQHPLYVTYIRNTCILELQIASADIPGLVFSDCRWVTLYFCMIH